MRVWTKTSDDWAVRERLADAIEHALDEQGIGIPYPQMDVHLDSLTPTNGEHSAPASDAQTPGIDL